MILLILWSQVEVYRTISLIPSFLREGILERTLHCPKRGAEGGRLQIHNFVLLMFLAVTWQVNRWPCHSLSQSVSDPLLILEHMTSHWMTESYPGDLWPLRHLFRVMRRHDMTKKIDKDNDKDKDKDKDILRTPPKSNPRDLWHLRHWLQFWQLRTWIHDNLCDLTINCDTGQHSQFLRCFYLFMRFMRFEIFIRIKRLICMKGILTLTHGQH